MNDFQSKIFLSIASLFLMFCGGHILKDVYEDWNEFSIGEAVVETTKSKRSGEIYKKEIRTYTVWDKITDQFLAIPIGILLIYWGVLCLYRLKD